MTEYDRRQDLLSKFESATDEEIIGFFEQDPDFGNYFSLDSGVWQNYSIKEHSLMVMNQFDRYFADDYNSKILTKGQFRVMLALHDIGKGPAVIDHGKDKGRKLQHIYTQELIPQFIEEIGFDEKVHNLILAIPTQEIMGSFLRKHIDPNRNTNTKVLSVEEALEKIKLESKHLDVDSKELFELLYKYFLSDAGSYTHDADPDMKEAPPGRENLDHLFIFDRKNDQNKGKMRLEPELEARVNELRQRLTFN